MSSVCVRSLVHVDRGVCFCYVIFVLLLLTGLNSAVEYNLFSTGFHRFNSACYMCLRLCLACLGLGL